MYIKSDVSITNTENPTYLQNVDYLEKRLVHLEWRNLPYKICVRFDVSVDPVFPFFRFVPSSFQNLSFCEFYINTTVFSMEEGLL